MINKATDEHYEEKRMRMLVAGFPGIGKSTLGLSAPKALHIDVDFGRDRVDPQYRTAYIQPKTYEEVLDDLLPVNLNEYETLVFDTGGKLLDLMKPWAIKNDPKNGKRDGSLSLAGYGAVGRELVRLMDYCFYELDKHIVILFHAKEDKEGDNTKLRLMIEGQSKDNVWQPIDLGGFVEMYGNDRSIGFSNCERYFAKGTRGINGIRKIPTLSDKVPNDFLIKLFDEYNSKAVAETENAKLKREAYDNAVAAGTKVVASVKDAKTANAAVPKLKEISHALTSETEVNTLFNAKTKELGLTVDKVAKMFMDPPPADKAEDKKETQ